MGSDRDCSRFNGLSSWTIDGQTGGFPLAGWFELSFSESDGVVEPAGLVAVLRAAAQKLESL